MDIGKGASEQTASLRGERATYYTDPSGLYRKRQKEEQRAEKGWTRHTAIGLQRILKMTDPEELREAANVVQGKYQTQKLHDKNPGNPFGHFSSDYYQLVNNYADALESEDDDAIQDARIEIEGLLQRVQDWAIPIRGASTGLGSAVSTKDRAQSIEASITAIIKRLIEKKRGVWTHLLPDGGNTVIQDVSVERQGDAFILKDPCEKASRRPCQYCKPKSGKPRPDLCIHRQKVENQNLVKTAKEVAETIAGDEQGITVQSIHGDEGDKGPEKAAYEPTMPTSELESWVDPDTVATVLKICLEEDIGKFVRLSPRYTKMALDSITDNNPKSTSGVGIGFDISQNEIRFPKFAGPPPEVDKKARKPRPMSVTEFRYAIRKLGPMASDYPGKGTPRSNVDVARGDTGWWKVGEDPEIEPLDSIGKEGYIWHSFWSQEEYPPMGPTEIAQEITLERQVLDKMGVPVKDAEKIRAGKAAVSKNAVSNQTKVGYAMFLIVAHAHNLANQDIDEGIEKEFQGVPFFEGIRRMDNLDRMIIARTAQWMANKMIEGVEDKPIVEKSVSKKQQRFMGMVRATQKGEKPASPEVAKVAKSMKPGDVKDFASTKHEGLPEKKTSSEGALPFSIRLQKTLYPIVESRFVKPAVIIMKRGTVIPAHHVRAITTPRGRRIVVAGLKPGRYEHIYTAGYNPSRNLTHKLRDFYAPGEWVPDVSMVKQGYQDETGWSEPEADGWYSAKRDFLLRRKFEKVLTMNAENVLEIIPVESIDDMTDEQLTAIYDQIIKKYPEMMKVIKPIRSSREWKSSTRDYRLGEELDHKLAKI